MARNCEDNTSDVDLRFEDKEVGAEERLPITHVNNSLDVLYCSD